MKKHFPHALSLFSICLLASLVMLPSACGQAVPAPDSARPRSAADEAVKLSAFEAKADSENRSSALQSDSLTAFRLDLDQAPVTAQPRMLVWTDTISS